MSIMVNNCLKKSTSFYVIVPKYGIHSSCYNILDTIYSITTIDFQLNNKIISSSFQSGGQFD